MNAQVKDLCRIFFGPTPVRFWLAVVQDEEGEKVPAIKLLYNNDQTANLLELISAMVGQKEQPRVLISAEELSCVPVTVLFEHLMRSAELLQKIAKNFLSTYEQRRKREQHVALFSNCYENVRREDHQSFMELFAHCGFFLLQIL